MKRPITGYGIDEENDWFAYLSCGHRQHVRHRPPFISRPWVTTRAGRDSMLGWPLNCVRCDRLEWPDGLVFQDCTERLSDSGLARALTYSHDVAANSWTRIVLNSGGLRLLIPELDFETHLSPDAPGIVPPHVGHQLQSAEPAQFIVETWRVPEPPRDDDGRD